MSANVFAFPDRGKGPQPWTNDELAELYRVVDLLGRAGLSVATDMGMSDEGDPWFVFCRVDNDEVIAHFARIDGVFVAASIAVDETFRGANFRQIVDRMVSSQPLVMPRPNSGSKLFLHPAVMLTAFVATALAHSQKTQALDWLHAVETQWGHNKAALLTEIKHIKTGWLDTLQTLWKLPLHDDKLGHEVREGQALTLASLIAIALAALQPITDKVAVLTHLITDELQGHGASQTQQASAHAAQLMQDMSMGDGSGSGTDHGGASGAGGSGGHGAARGDGGDGTVPELHRIAAAPTITDNSADAQKAALDASHLAALSAVQKTATDDSIHAAASAAESTADNGAFLLMQQKAAAMAQVQAQTTPVQTETFVFLADSASATTSVISTNDVTTQALQALSIHAKTTESTTGTPATSDDPTTPTHPATTDGSGSTPDTGSPGIVAVAAAAPSTTPAVTTSVPQTPTNQVVDDVNAPLTTVIQAISNFVNTDSHLVSNAASLTVNAALQQQLDSYFTAGTSSLKVVFFDASSSSVPDVFLFSTGVVFVEEKDISPNLHLTNGGGNLILQVDSLGGTVTLVGVATIEQQHTVSA